MGFVARLVCARPGVIVAVGVSLAVAGAVVTALKWNLLNNSSDLLSANYAPMQHYNELRRDFGSDYRYIILIRSPDIQENRAIADEVGQWLPTLRPQITTVLSKIDFSSVMPSSAPGIHTLECIPTPLRQRPPRRQSCDRLR